MQFILPKQPLCLLLLQVPKCFVPFQIFWASPKIWLHLVPLQKLLCRHKNQFYWMQIIFLSGTKCLWLALNAVKFLGWLKKSGLTQNILGPVKGQGISYCFYLGHISGHSQNLVLEIISSVNNLGLYKIHMIKEQNKCPFHSSLD